MRFLIVCTMAIFVIYAPAYAETIKLESGKTIEGKILSQNDEEVKIDLNGVAITYWPDQIESINGVAFSSMNKISPSNNDSAAIPNIEKEIFVARLNKLLTLGAIRNPTQDDLDEFDSAFNDFSDFAKEYPESQLKDDVEYIAILMDFILMASGEDPQQAAEYIPKMEDLIHKNPKIEEFVLDMIKISETMLTFPMLIPYEYVPHYMKGFLAFSEGNWDEVIKEHGVLRDNLSLQNYGDVVGFNVYPDLCVAYSKTGQTEKMNQVIIEMKKFPQNQQMMQFVDKIIEKEREKGNIINVK